MTWLATVPTAGRARSGKRQATVETRGAGERPDAPDAPVARVEAALAALQQPADPPADALAPDLSGQTIQSRARREEAVYVESTDSEYWLALCFHSRADKADILARCGLTPDDPDKHLDAREFLGRLVDVVVALPDAVRADRDALRQALMPDRPRELRRKTVVSSRWLAHIPR